MFEKLSHPKDTHPVVRGRELWGAGDSGFVFFSFPLSFVPAGAGELSPLLAMGLQFIEYSEHCESWLYVIVSMTTPSLTHLCSCETLRFSVVMFL